MRRCHIWIVLILVWLGSVGFASEAGQTYSMADEFARIGREDFAFMYYNELLRSYPTSRYRQQALFATGEYYFLISGFQEAEAIFKKFIEEYPDSEQELYALAYLLNIAKRNNDTASVEKLEKEIIGLQQVSLVFRDKKEITHHSPLYKNYKAVIHIDKIEFYVEGKLFAKVSY